MNQPLLILYMLVQWQFEVESIIQPKQLEAVVSFCMYMATSLSLQAARDNFVTAFSDLCSTV